jgi:hypothetical protein
MPKPDEYFHRTEAAIDAVVALCRLSLRESHVAFAERGDKNHATFAERGDKHHVAFAERKATKATPLSRGDLLCQPTFNHNLAG